MEINSIKRAKQLFKRPFRRTLGVGELACLLFVVIFLLCSSPILHLALIGLVAFLVAHVANHGLSFTKLLHSLNDVILMMLGLLRFAFYLSQVLGKTSHLLLELLILHCDLLCVYISTTTFSTQTWLHKDESKHKSL